MKLTYTDEQKINQFIQEENGLLAILFSSPSCGYCTMMERNLQQVISSLPSFPLLKCNVDESTELTASLGIRSIPALKLFRNGEVVHTFFGVRTPDDLYYTIKSYL